MKVFKLKAEVTFDAENLRNAAQQLSDHFKQIVNEYNENIESVEESIDFSSGEIELSPLKDES